MLENTTNLQLEEACIATSWIGETAIEPGDVFHQLAIIILQAIRRLVHDQSALTLVINDHLLRISTELKIVFHVPQEPLVFTINVSQPNRRATGQRFYGIKSPNAGHVRRIIPQNVFNIIALTL